VRVVLGRDYESKAYSKVEVFIKVWQLSLSLIVRLQFPIVQS